MQGCMAFPNFDYLTQGQNKSECNPDLKCPLKQPDIDCSTIRAVHAEMSAAVHQVILAG